MGFLSDIFSIKSFDSTVNAVINTGDALVFTDEERANMKVEFLKHFEPFKIAQRVISFFFTVNFIIAFWFGVGLYFSGGEIAFKHYIEIVDKFQLGWIMLAIVSFYFTGGVINSFGGKK